MAKKTVANLNIKLSAGTATLRRDFKQASGSVKGFKGSLAGIATKLGAIGVAVGAVTTAVGSFAISLRSVGRAMTSLDATTNVASKLGLAANELEGLRLSAERSGIASNTLDMALQRMTRRIAEAANGTGEAKDAIKELGLDAQALNNAGPAEAFRQIAEAMKGVDSQGDRLRLAFKLFDSEGAGLVNTLSDGREAFDEAAKDADRFGLTVSDAARKDVAEMMERLGDLGKIAKGLATQIGHSLVPMFNAFLDDAVALGVETVAAFKEWAPTIRDVAKTVGNAIGGMIDDIRQLVKAIRNTRDEWVQLQAKFGRRPRDEELRRDAGGKLQEAARKAFPAEEAKKLGESAGAMFTSGLGDSLSLAFKMVAKKREEADETLAGVRAELD